MTDSILTPSMAGQMEELYARMEARYNEVAEELQLSCRECSDNCCDSYFLHHTYIEWSFLWRGIRELAPPRQQAIFERARDYVLAAEKALGRNSRPQIMCPLNEDGLCSVYTHRLMVCRTHGVPAVLVRPDGRKMEFPGCFRCQEKVVPGVRAVYMERTSMLQELVRLEQELLNNQRHLYPKVKLTIAEMVVKGPPSLPRR